MACSIAGVQCQQHLQRGVEIGSFWRSNEAGIAKRGCWQKSPGQSHFTTLMSSSSVHGRSLHLLKVPNLSRAYRKAGSRGPAQPRAQTSAASAAKTVAEQIAVSEDSFIDSISRWIWHKIQPPCTTCSADGHRAVDWLAWLPDPIHERLHNCEATAVVVVRETLLLFFAYAVFVNAERVYRQLNWIWGTYLRKDDDVTEEEFRSSGFSALVVPTQFFTVVLSVTRHIREALPRIRIPVDRHLIGRVRGVAFVMAVTWFLMGWKRRTFDQWKSTATKVDKPRLLAADRLTSLVLIMMGFFTAAETCGIPLRSVTAFGGITGIAIGLASKEVVTNFFGGLVLWLTRPFVIGDAIKADKFSGIVQDVGFFQTKLLGFDKSHITVPNQVFTNMVITNMSRAQHRNMEATFELRHQDILKVDSITQKISAMIKAHPAVDVTAQRPVCYVKSIGNFSVVLAISAAAKPTRSADFYAAQQEILVNAAKIIIEEGAFLGSNGAFPPTQIELPGGSENGATIVSEQPVSTMA